MFTGTDCRNFAEVLLSPCCNCFRIATGLDFRQTGRWASSKRRAERPDLSGLKRRRPSMEMVNDQTTSLSWSSSGSPSRVGLNRTGSGFPASPIKQKVGGGGGRWTGDMPSRIPPLKKTLVFLVKNADIGLVTLRSLYQKLEQV
ncbi:virulence sensor histidine kinase PhoQ [Striga asiatica]|uniref:Virulence sensor histidine kinase PhoQ n=1 Tax=Striga asiatica TaxID=4170 RepID=A0A5A7R7V6_STRAF|nr:virulence sensor histidine kinase PhoQ [Striga asiatica]